mmetsp:Transcript_105693/g.297685  ORF Transcript_105693/g.297685 Transcript_105693/m.297685 type:complete len:186 (-) Transcript_105693:109-666(-)
MNTVLPWRIYVKVDGSMLQTTDSEFSTVTTTQDPLTRRATAVMGPPCQDGGYAEIVCRAVVRTKWMYPVDHLEHVGIELEHCVDWMVAHAWSFRTLILVGPFWQKCLTKIYKALPLTRFMTIDFCQPPELQAENIACGEFSNTLPNLEWGMKGYKTSYESGLAYQAKIDLITSVTVKELANVRAR